MNFDWDEDKNLINIKKHGISFKNAAKEINSYISQLGGLS